MARLVDCVKLGRQAEGLEQPTYPGDLGQRIFESVSRQAWAEWLALQTMLINENRLSPINREHRKYLEEQMENHFFGDGAEQPAGYTPTEPDAS